MEDPGYDGDVEDEGRWLCPRCGNKYDDEADKYLRDWCVFNVCFPNGLKVKSSSSPKTNNTPRSSTPITPTFTFRFIAILLVFYFVMIGTRNMVFAEESAEVELLRAQAEKQRDFNKRLLGTLGRVSELGNSLKLELGPVYNDTQSLQTVTDNAGRLLNELQKQTRPLEGKADEERTIRDGPAAVGVQTYLASLKRAEDKLSNLKSTNFRVNQEAMSELGNLLNHGRQQLQALFESLLHEDANAIEPLQFITKQISFPGIPQNKLSELAALDGFVSANQSRTGYQDSSPSARIYANVRGSYLSGSLHNLASASISTSKKKSPDTIYRQGTSGIGTYANAIEGIFLAEWRNITLIFPRDTWSTIFELTTRQAVTEFSKTLRELSVQIKSNITTDCFLAYEIVGIVNLLAIRMDSQTGQLKQQLIDAVKPVRDTAKASIGDLLDDIRRRMGAMITIPNDGAALPITTEVMSRLQALVLYPQPLSSILTSLGDGSWSSSANANGSTASLPSTKSFDVGADGNQLLAHYASDTIEMLLSNLESLAKRLVRSKAIHGVFMANNVAIIDRMIRSSEIQSLFSSTNTPNKVEIWRKKAIGTYLDAWREPCAALMDVQYTNRGARPPSGSNAVDSAAIVKGLSSKDKDALKEKFKSFNLSFEVLSAKHKEMSQSMEREVRSQLARDIQAMIEPLYARFWDRYHEVDKGRGKYVRYDKGTLSAQLSSMG
ncbi:exocyst complex component exo70 [Xylographa bjoerkii]|nr:exocyst complex component exo70 [Xylographa bjoerkii]